MSFADIWRAETDALIRDMQRPRWGLGTLWPSSMFHIDNIGVPMDEFSRGGEALSQYNGPSVGTLARMPTLKERIALAVTQAQEKLAAVREAQEIFDRNPDLERLLNLMQKNHF